MRAFRALVLGVAIASVPVPVSAQASLAATKKQIAQLEDTWIQAVIKRDVAAFDRLLAPSFVYTEDDRVYSRSELIKEMTAGADTVKSGRNEDLTVRVYGNTAVATGWLILAGRNAKGSFERRYRYTDTWQKSGNTWRVIAAHDYLKP
jgi:ketosteroid isomerase-like protein